MREERGRGQQRPHHFHMFNLLEESFALLHNELPPVKSHKCQEIKNNFTTSAMQKSAQAIQYPYEMQHSSVMTFWTAAHFGHCRENLYKKLA